MQGIKLWAAKNPSKLAPLLQALLTEAAAIERVRCDNRETGDDQDNP